ncbi:MAG: efflux RND transporter periplasmic adaptor subunit [Peptococcaceae bacterium]
MKKSRIFSIMILLLVSILALSGCGQTDQGEEEITVNKIPVETMEVTKGDFTKYLVLSGVTNPGSVVNVLPKIAGGEKIIAINVKEGDKVTKGQVIATLDQSTVSIQLDQAQKAYDDALKNYERNKVLVESGAIPQVNFEQVESALNQARNALDSARLAFNNTIIHAPVNGTVTVLAVEEGMLASAQTSLCTIVDINTLELNTSVNELQINKITLGQEVNVSIPSADAGIYEGKISFISPVMDERSKSYAVKVAIDNPENAIKGGMYAKVEVTTDIHKDVVTVPRKAVDIKDGESKVFVVEGEKAVLKEVETGLNNGREIEIIKGLQAGEQIVVTGNEDLVDQDLITVVNRGEDQ